MDLKTNIKSGVEQLPTDILVYAAKGCAAWAESTAANGSVGGMSDIIRLAVGYSSRACKEEEIRSCLYTCYEVAEGILPDESTRDVTMINKMEDLLRAEIDRRKTVARNLEQGTGATGDEHRKKLRDGCLRWLEQAQQKGVKPGHVGGQIAYLYKNGPKEGVEAYRLRDSVETLYKRASKRVDQSTCTQTVKERAHSICIQTVKEMVVILEKELQEGGVPDASTGLTNAEELWALIRTFAHEQVESNTNKNSYPLLLRKVQTEYLLGLVYALKEAHHCLEDNNP